MLSQPQSCCIRGFVLLLLTAYSLVTTAHAQIYRFKYEHLLDACPCGNDHTPVRAASLETPPTTNDFFETYADGSRPALLEELKSSETLSPRSAGGQRDNTQPLGSLTGRIVYMGAGHGWTFANTGSNPRWYTQRGITHSMIEDYGNLDQMNFFAAYCFNAGATVVPTRPLGFQTNEVVLDNDDPGVSFVGPWSVSSSPIYYGSAGDLVPYRFASLSATEIATATYTPNIPVAGFYPVYCWTRHGSDRTRQLYRINHTGGQSLIRVPHHMVGNGWVYLGTYYFDAGFNPERGAVIISNLQHTPAFGGVVIADAIRFGNGMGDIARKSDTGTDTPRISGYPREEEGARYWIQAGLGQGQSTSLYNGGGDDGADNVGAPIRLAREMNREAAGSLRDRVYISFHSNAGGGRGVVGLYNNNELFPGTGTPNQFLLAQLIGRELNNDMAAVGVPPLEVAWFKRGDNSVTYARSEYAFGEIRNDVLGGEMDATINEVAFHDHADDAKLLRDPKVRDLMARSTYKAVIHFFNQITTNAVPLNFLPNPPTYARASSTENGITVSWGVPGSGGGLATGYTIYRSRDGYGFTPAMSVTGGSTLTYTFREVEPDTEYYFRIVATNAGGESLPSPVVGCRLSSSGQTPVLFVNGYDRFDRNIALRQQLTTGVIDRVKPRQMNAFDYVVPHGRALSASGVPFDSCANESIITGQIKLTNYPVVIWALGRESTTDETFSSQEQTLVTAYQSAGGHLFVSGTEVGWDLDRASGPTASDRNFYRQQLHATLGSDVNDDALTYTFSPASGSIFAGNPVATFDDGSKGGYATEYPDVVNPTGTGSRAALQYVGGLGGPAAVQYDGSSGGGRVVYFGFPFEAIIGESTRETYMRDILRYFQALPLPVLAIPEVRLNEGRVILSWTTIPEQKYQVQYKNSLGDTEWSPLGEIITAPADEAVITVEETGVAQTRFYRIILVE